MIQAYIPAAGWSVARKILFRLSFLFFTLYIFLNPNGFLPYSEDVHEIYIQPFHKLIPWIGAHILRLSYPITTFTNGSGDTTYDWVVLLLIVSLALVGCMVWSLIDRRRLHYNTLLYWLNVIARYYLALTLINYGMAKLDKSQFPFPSTYTLLESYGNSSPMRLAWTFLGYSKGYNYFMGFAELTAGMLLLFRRTIRVGAIVALVVTANVMAINYCFDVCVKQLSTILVIMSIFLLLQGWEHHLNFFFLNREVRPESLTRPTFRRRWINRALAVTKYVFIIGVIGYTIYGAVGSSNQYGDNAPKPLLYGVYNVQTFVRNEDTLPPLMTDARRWRRFIVTRYGRSGVQLMNDSEQFYINKPDTMNRRIGLSGILDTSLKADFAYTFYGKDQVLLAGRWMGDSVRMTLKGFDTDSLLLVQRGFHLINEQPFNR
ncbi:MAG: hypothetical protein BGO55_24495 [Sphingobacteriales bacterium 50-39]|nr:DoxX family membrane protein [Sphingobacteriales bacterium]OJW58453.1 MAG: hypothetical protein BGO55_24495 [Sphingobacteriales bacterium 50-39]